MDRVFSYEVLPYLGYSLEREREILEIDKRLPAYHMDFDPKRPAIISPKAKRTKVSQRSANALKRCRVRRSGRIVLSLQKPVILSGHRNDALRVSHLDEHRSQSPPA